MGYFQEKHGRTQCISHKKYSSNPRNQQYQVQEHQIINKSILQRINLPNMESLVAKRQLRWLGQTARMDEKQLPLKMVSCWMQST
jgi:hypothetical protein